MRLVAFIFSLLLAVPLAAWASALPGQQQNANSSDQQQQDKNKKKADNRKDANAKPANPSGDKPQPLFGGSLNLKSSRQSKDTATLGFNGLDPNGQVQKAALNSPAGPADTQKAQQIADSRVDQAELSAFINDGKLNPQAAPKQASGKRR